jgi:hypothetical protein
MAVRHQWSVGFGLTSVACALALLGCAAPAAPARPGELQLRVDPEASYAVVGRFHVNAIEPWSPSRDVDFDTATSQARIELPPGTYALALGAGARLVCAGEDPEPFAEPSTVPRLVSASPQVISIAPGEITTARIRFGASPQARVEAAVDGETNPADSSDPCGARVEVAAWP